MPASTPLLAMPYPVATDPADVPKDVKALADRIEAVGPTVQTSLPASPFDGQEVFLKVDTAGTYGGPYYWHCRYDAAQAGNSKWQVAAAAELFHGATSQGAYTTGGAFVFGPAFNAPIITLPVRGDWQIEAFTSLQGSANYSDLRLGVFAAGTQITGSFGGAGAISTSMTNANLSCFLMKTALAASTVLDLRLVSNAAGAVVNVYDRAMRVRPVRLG